MGLKHHLTSKNSPSSPTIRSTTFLPLALLFITTFILFVIPLVSLLPDPIFRTEDHRFHGDLREAQFAWNKLCFGPPSEKLKLAVFSKTWPVLGAALGGMERHASILYTALAARGHQVHVFTVPSDRKPHPDIHEGTLHVHFAPNSHGSLNCSLAFEIFNQENLAHGPYDYVHTESVSLPHWRAKNMVPKVAVTWHGIWYEIMHSKLFQELLSPSDPQREDTDLRDAMLRLLDEIRFFPSYTQHICISNSASEALVNIYQIPSKNVHVILNGVDHTRFQHNPIAGMEFRKQNGVPSNATLVMGVAGRLVRDKGHPLLYKAFSSVIEKHPGLFLLVAGSGPWEKRYAELGSSVKVLGALDLLQLMEFYNALDVFVDPTLRPQGLDLTLMEAMQCGKPVLAPSFPSVTGTVVVSEELGYTFAPNVGSFVEALEMVVRDGPERLNKKGMFCKVYAMEMFTATKMASAYERFFLCMKSDRYCRFPLPTNCVN